MSILKPKNSQENNKIENRIYWDTFLIMLMNELSTIGASFVDVLLVTKFFNETAVAAQGVVQPFYSVIGLITGSLMYGTQKICIRYLGNGDKERAQSSFNTTLFVSIQAGLIATFILFVFAGPVVTVFGASKANLDLYNVSIEYLRGLSIGIISLILVPILSPIAQVEGKKKNITISLIVIIVLDAFLDFIAGYFNLGMFYIGLATSASQWVGLVILYLPFIKKSFFKVKVSWVNSKELVLILREGLPKLVKRFCKIVKPITINTAIIAIGGVAAMGTVSIRNTFSGLLESIGAALGACIGMLTPLYYGERNLFALKRLIKTSKKALLSLLIPVCALVVVFAPQISLIYAADKPELYNYVVIAIRCVGLDLIFMALLELLMCYWQSISKIREVSIVVVLQKLILPIVSLFSLSAIFGINGVWYSFPVSSFLSIVSFVLISLFEKVFMKLKDKGLVFLIPNELFSDKQVSQEIYINSANEVSDASELIRNECIKAGIEAKRAFHLALCFEEVVCNTIEHGFKKDNKKNHYIDAFLCIENKEVILRIRDDCVHFDMVEKYNVFHGNDDPTKLIGIRMVMKLAKDVNYVNTFSTNSVILKV